jgi:hypothetical protein
MELELRNKLAGVFLVMTLGLVGQISFAQNDAPQPATVETTNEAEADSASDTSNQEQPTETQDEEINPDASFTPTEEISEDKPVAFPVDI